MNCCKEIINNGTEDEPRHSCNKCIENDILTQEQREKGKTIVKITFSENYTSYCNISESYNIIENCSEAMREIDSKGNENLICNKCEKDNKLVYVADKDLKICQYFRYEEKCMVKDCETCKKGNNYFCFKCLLDDYEVDQSSGQCIKKAINPPIITWKDIFRLILNSQLTINGMTIYGPSLILRGITKSEIISGHAFLITLVFSIKLSRNLEEVGEQGINGTSLLNVPAICQTVDHYDETKNKINIVDYQCIGNRTGEDQFKETEVALTNIKENNTFSDYLTKSNFEEMANDIDFENITNKDTSSFTLSMASEVVIFEMEGDNFYQKSDNYTYEFTINGKINKDLENQTIKGKFKLVEIKNVSGNCEINIREKKNADIKFNINLEKYPQYKVVSLKTIEIQNKNSNIYFDKLNDIKLIHKGVDEEKEEKETKNNFLKILLIIISIVLIVIIIIVFFIIKNIKSKKIKKNNDIINSNQYITEKKDSIQNKKIMNESVSTTKRINPSTGN